MSAAVTPQPPKPVLYSPPVVFKRLEVSTKRRLILSVEGLQKRGKTNFALTAPGPIAVHNFDFGLEGVVDKFVNDKEIFAFDYPLQRSTALPGTEKGETLSGAALKLWEEFVLNYRESLKRTKTVVIDTASEAWELLRLARLGKLAQVLPAQYSAVNAEFRELLRLPLELDSNLILLHKQKKEYVNDKPTGNYERAGFGDIGFVVQANLLAWRDEKAEGLDKFKVKVLDSRHKPLAVGLEFVGEGATFAKVATALVDGTNEEDWK